MRATQPPLVARAFCFSANRTPLEAATSIGARIGRPCDLFDWTRAIFLAERLRLQPWSDDYGVPAPSGVLQQVSTCFARYSAGAPPVDHRRASDSRSSGRPFRPKGGGMPWATLFAGLVATLEMQRPTSIADLGHAVAQDGRDSPIPPDVAAISGIGAVVPPRFVLLPATQGAPCPYRSGS